MQPELLGLIGVLLTTVGVMAAAWINRSKPVAPEPMNRMQVLLPYEVLRTLDNLADAADSLASAANLLAGVSLSDRRRDPRGQT